MWAVGVRWKQDPRRVTYFCADGKAEWTRELGKVKWWDSEREARGEMERLKKEREGRYWASLVEWKVESKGGVEESLRGLEPELNG